jgi:hypothetical protein
VWVCVLSEKNLESLYLKEKWQEFLWNSNRQKLYKVNCQDKSSNKRMGQSPERRKRHILTYSFIFLKIWRPFLCVSSVRRDHVCRWTLTSS